MVTNLLRILVSLVAPHKFKYGINSPLQSIFLDKILHGLPNWNDILCRNTQLQSSIQLFLPQIGNDDSSPDSAHDLERIETKPTKSKKKSSFFFLDLSAASNTMISCSDSISSDCSDGRLNTYYRNLLRYLTVSSRETYHQAMESRREHRPRRTQHRIRLDQSRGAFLPGIAVPDPSSIQSSCLTHIPEQQGEPHGLPEFQNQ
jgi:hypothetical protein